MVSNARSNAQQQLIYNTNQYNKILSQMIKLHRSQDGQFYFTLCNTKGQVRLTSETYVSRSNRNREVLRLNKQLLKPVKIVDCDEEDLKGIEAEEAKKLKARQLDKRS